MKGKHKVLLFFLIVCTIFNITTLSHAYAFEISLNDNNFREDLPSLQELINNTKEGSTIHVKAGIYKEILNIKKKITLIGESKENTIINPNSEKNKYAIRIGSPNITIKNLSIKNGGPGLYSTGIKITASGVKVEDCYIFDTPVGISIFTSNNVIKNCEFSGCKDEGIVLIGSLYSECKNNEIRNCIFHDNCDGIELQRSSDNIIINCEFFNNTHAGIDAICSSNNRNIISNCKIYNNNVHGIYFHSSSDNQINNCKISNNKDGNIVECKNSLNNEIKISNSELEENNILEKLIDYLQKIFQKRHQNIQAIIMSIYKSNQNLLF
jgi:parallel beta-helix repeat protein